MELLQLRYFLEAARYQHMTKAAESLHVAQPAISQSIHHLEEELGMPLFIRESRGIRLNESGKLLQKKLIPLMASLDAIPGELKEAAAQTQPTIRLSLLAASTIITNCIIAYRSKRPDVKFKLLQTKEDPSADYRIFANRSETALTDEQHLLFSEDFFLAVPTSSPLSSCETIRLADTQDESYVSLQNPHSIRDLCDYFCREAGFSPNIVYESDNPETVRNLIAAGLGIAFWPQYSWGPLVSDHVKLLSIETPICRRQILASISQKGEQNPDVMDFHYFLCQWIQEHFAHTLR